MFEFFRKIIKWAVDQLVKPFNAVIACIGVACGWIFDWFKTAFESVWGWAESLFGTIVEDIFALIKNVGLWALDKAWALFHLVVDFVLSKIPSSIVQPTMSSQLHATIDAANRWVPIAEAFTIGMAIFTFWLFVIAFRWSKQLVPGIFMGSRS